MDFNNQQSNPNNPYLGYVEQRQKVSPNFQTYNTNNPGVNNASFGFNTLREDETRQRTPKSMGLTMGNSIRAINDEKPSDVIKEEKRIPETVNPSFNRLTIPGNRESSNRFGVQPLAENIERSMLPKPVTEEDIRIANERLNKAENPSRRKISNWFSRLLDQRGQDYISSGKLTIDEVSKNAERIIDDMIAGKIDYDIYGKYIIEPVIIQTLINYCANKLAINKVLQFSLGYTYNDYMSKSDLTDDPERYMTLCNIDDGFARNMAQSISIINQDIGVYSILYNKLCYANTTKNTSSLFSLTNDLNNYKKQMRKRY